MVDLSRNDQAASRFFPERLPFLQLESDNT
jgi:hypothetical protein